MSVEFVDTNVLVLRARWVYVPATKELGMTSQQAEEVLVDPGGWILHRPTYADLMRAAHLQRRSGVSCSGPKIYPTASAMDP